MKGGGPYPLPAKKRWRGLVIGVLGLVVLSMLVPLVFLLGLHTGLYSSSGYGGEQLKSASSGLKVIDPRDDFVSRNDSKVAQLAHIDELIRKLGPTLAEEFRGNSVEEAGNKTSGRPMPAVVQKQRPRVKDAEPKQTINSTDNLKGSAEIQKLCESRFGSYCLWRQEHREQMNDSIVKKMKDLLYVARAYYPSIAKLPSLDKLTLEMKQNIQEFERVLSETTTDKDIPAQIERKLKKMQAVIQRAKSYPVDCNNVDKKFRQLVDLTEDEASFHMKQSAFLYQLAVQTLPKSLHCLSMRLTVEYFGSSPDMAKSQSNRHLNPELQHYVIFSNNVLASSVVINSTIMHAKETENKVFHVLTDRENFFAMRMWFFRNKYKEAVIQVVNIEELELNGLNESAPLHLSLPEEFRISYNKIEKHSTVKTGTAYISVFSHIHYLLPILFPTLEKIVILDDDVVVQRDLSFLWSLNMEGKVNGALQVCTVRLGQLKSFFGDESFNEDSCAWMSGVNVVDLVRWRAKDLTKTYQRLVQKMKTQEGLSDTCSLYASLLTFQGEIYGLDDKSVLSGLGHNYGVDMEAIVRAAVLHFNGNMKPWLDLGISEYVKHWSKYLNQDNQLLRDCNLNTLKP